MISGGADVDPARYGQPPHGTTRSEPDRDALELALIERALDRDLPILGICRGFQLLNVYFGGTLIQDLPDHRADDAANSAHHSIRVAPDSYLGRLIGMTETRVNSRHHQGLRGGDLAPPLRATALADDQLIEAFEHPGYRWVIGVQWHPERIDEVPKEFSALFRAFVAESSRSLGRVT
jgi:putative glutamine amidotransferase